MRQSLRTNESVSGCVSFVSWDSAMDNRVNYTGILGFPT